MCCSQVYYDYSYQLVRFDYRSGGGYPYNTMNPVTEIHDYGTGRVACGIIVADGLTLDGY